MTRRRGTDASTRRQDPHVANCVAASYRPPLRHRGHRPGIARSDACREGATSNYRADPETRKLRKPGVGLLRRSDGHCAASRALPTQLTTRLQFRRARPPLAAHCGTGRGCAVRLVLSCREVGNAWIWLPSAWGGSRARTWWVGGSEACDEDSGLPAGELVPVGCVREWLGEHRSGDDDVDRGGVWLDGPVAASAGEDLLEEVPDLALERDDLLVMDDGAAVEREDELVAGRDRLFEELR